MIVDSGEIIDGPGEDRNYCAASASSWGRFSTTAAFGLRRRSRLA
ncbi:hypothetical protein [Antrihabitans stalagmiti]|nr:hypothetical protein [Antrihabitans stalagmiti]